MSSFATERLAAGYNLADVPDKAKARTNLGIDPGATGRIELGYVESSNTESTNTSNTKSFLQLPVVVPAEVPGYVTADVFVQGASSAVYCVSLWVNESEAARSLVLYGNGPYAVHLVCRLEIGDGVTSQDVSVRYGPINSTDQVDLVANAPGRYFNRLRVTQ